MAKRIKFRQYKTENGTSNHYLTKLGRTEKLQAVPRVNNTSDVLNASILGDVFSIARNLKKILTSKE